MSEIAEAKIFDNGKRNLKAVQTMVRIVRELDRV